MNGHLKAGFAHIQYFRFHVSQWLALFAAVWLGSLVQAQADGPVANNQTNSTAVLSQKYGIHLSYANPGGGTVSFRLLDAPAGTLEYWDHVIRDYLPITTNTVVNSAGWNYSTAATDPGEDSFVWEVRDAGGAASSATFVLNLISNTTISLVSQSRTLAVGSVRAAVHQNHTDPDSFQIKHYRLITPPIRGVLEHRPSPALYP